MTPQLYLVAVTTEKFVCSGVVLATSEAEAGRLLEDKLQQTTNAFFSHAVPGNTVPASAFRLKLVQVRVSPLKVINFSWDTRALPDHPTAG